jgi:hypothetical protein
VFEFTESVDVDAGVDRVWAVMTDLEGWWPESNPEHISLERLDDRGIAEGARMRVRERIAGVRCEAIGEITEVLPGRSVTWEASQAHYRLLGVSVCVGEGVEWRIEPGEGEPTRISARVWATFPEGWSGRALAWVFRRLLDGIEKDREHTRIELRHLKRLIEQQ